MSNSVNLIEPIRVVTEIDHVRIQNLLSRQPSAMVSNLEEVLDSADLVRSEDVPVNVVTMNSQVLVADIKTGEERQLTLCYPADVDPASGAISVLSPVGSSLLGLPVGAVARWDAPDGSCVGTKVQAIVFQPEANGDYLA